MSGNNATLYTAEEALSTISGGKILDVATGSGGFITFLLDNIRDYTDITAIDINERPLEAARKAFTQDNVHFLYMDAAKMDFPDGYYDTVCISNSLHHMENLPAVFSEMLRVCKPGGQVIISEMYRDRQSETQLTHVYLHHWWAAVDQAEGIIHRETYSRQGVIDLIEAIGLSRKEYYEMMDLDADPKDPELLHELDGIIDRYIQRTSGKPGEPELRRRGEELRQRAHDIGFHGATTLLMVGRK